MRLLSVLLEALAVLLFAALVTALLLIHQAARVLGAPAPPARPAPALTRADLVGLWRMSWGEAVWRTRLSDDGHYASWQGGSTWVGVWRVEDGVLTVEEWSQRTYPEGGYVWRASLSRTRGGFAGKVLPPAASDTFRLETDGGGK